MPEITTFGKRFCFLFLQDLGEKKVFCQKAMGDPRTR
jgi:hypothetical protein